MVRVQDLKPDRLITLPVTKHRLIVELSLSTTSHKLLTIDYQPDWIWWSHGGNTKTGESKFTFPLSSICFLPAIVGSISERQVLHASGAGVI